MQRTILGTTIKKNNKRYNESLGEGATVAVVWGVSQAFMEKVAGGEI